MIIAFVTSLSEVSPSSAALSAFVGLLITAAGLWLKHRYDMARFMKESRSDAVTHLTSAVTTSSQLIDTITQDRERTSLEFESMLRYERSARKELQSEHEREIEHLQAKIERREKRIRDLIKGNAKLSESLDHVGEITREVLEDVSSIAFDD